MASTRIILITGATRGLGRAMTDKFTQLGHTVIGCGRSQANIDSLRKKYGPPHAFEALNVANDKQVAAWAKRVIASHGAPDLLLNNAALINRNAPLWKVPAEEFDNVIDVNIKGVVNVIRHFVPAMIAKKSGTIVNFSSGWGHSTSPEVAPYCATKFAIEGLSQALSQELPAGMAAIAFSPGVINTEMLQSCMTDSADSYPDPDVWVEKAAPYLLKLGPKDNGKSLRL